MAWFRSQKEESKKEDQKSSLVQTSGAKVRAHVSEAGRIPDVLRHPRITEKATDLRGRRTYVFNVTQGANKRSVAEAVRRTYNVSPLAIRIVQIPAKKRRNARTGRLGITSSAKKAYVYLKEGDTITIS